MIGPHINVPSTQVLEFIERTHSPAALLMKPKGEESWNVKNANPAMLLIGRPDVGPDGVVHSWYLEGDPTAAGQRAAAICLQYQASNQVMGAWVLNNEPPVGSLEQIGRLAAFDIAFARSMKAGGSRACIGAFARGTPQIPSIDGGAALRAYLPALRVAEEVGALVAFHQYGYNPLLKNAEWSILRWQRHILPWLAEKQGLSKFEYIISETGCDLATGRREGSQVMDGWRTGFKDTPEGREAYATQLLAVVTEYAKDHRCRGALLFCSGNEAQWGDFDVNGDMLERLMAVSWPKRASAPVPIVTPPAPAPQPIPKPPATGGGSTVAPLVSKYSVPLSSHHSDRLGRAIQYIILHTTESPIGTDQQETLNYLLKNSRKVSCNDYIARWFDGGTRIYMIVPYARASHHAGAASARLPNGATGGEVNLRTIGIEVFRPVNEQVPSAVVEATIDHVAGLCKEYSLTTSQILSHAQVDPTRRSDPVGIDMAWFRDRVGMELGAMTVEVPTAPLPEHESVEDLAEFLRKATWWSQEHDRQYIAGQWLRASNIRKSMIRLLEKGRDRWAR